jgi:SAM-dependent methyltransferase
MHINYRYVLHFAEIQRGGSSTFTILDYGCGAGDVVVAGRERGMNFFGSEVFYAASASNREVVEHKGLLGTLVREMRNGRLDFPDAYFDLVTNNQVLEHVADLDQVLDEIDRVLKPGGKVLSLFPSRDVWREGHSGIPFLHRFSRNSKVRYHYALAFRKLGFGHHKGTKTPEQWARNFVAWLDNYCFYRSRRTILAAFRRHFSVKLVEDDYIQFRLGGSRLRPLARLTQWPVFKPVGKELFRKLGGLVILGTKPHGTS